MIAMRLREIAAAVGAPFDPRFDRVMIRRVSTDSRDVSPGDLFVAIRGECFDGHRFVAEAMSKGAAACLCDEVWNGAEKSAELPASFRCLVVPETVAGLGRLAGYYRRHVMNVATVVVGVTGSNGKTTTKGMIDHVLRPSFAGRAAPKNYNNHIGVPLTLLSSETGDRYLVVEIGTNSTGEVAALSSLARPDAAVITSIGEAHLEGLGGIDGVAAEKASLLHHVRSDGLVVVNIDRPEIHAHLPKEVMPRLITIGADPSAKFCVADLSGDLRRTEFTLDGRFSIELPLPGVHHAANAAATFAVGRWFGVEPQRIIERLRTFTPPEGRTRVHELDGVTVVDDAYNANPASMAAAIAALGRIGSARRVFVMGDMLELGESCADYHLAAAASAVRAGIEVLVLVGPAMQVAASLIQGQAGDSRVVACASAEEARELLASAIEPGDTVWVKGSRGIGLDRVVVDLCKRYGEQTAVA